MDETTIVDLEKEFSKKLAKKAIKTVIAVGIISAGVLVAINYKARSEEVLVIETDLSDTELQKLIQLENQ